MFICSFVHRSSLKFDAQLSNSYSTCFGDEQVETWRRVTKMSVKHDVVGKKKSDKDKQDCVKAAKRGMSVGLKASKQTDFCCMLCDK